MNLDDAFASGELLHPIASVPNSVDLFRTVSTLAGGPAFPDGEHQRRLADAIGHHDHYLFVVVDGLGLSLEPRFPSGGFLASAFRDELRSVFPSTTAVALTSLATGAWPCAHGITGWFTYFPEHRRVLAPLLFRERCTGVPASDLGLSMRDLTAATPYLGSFFRTVTSILPAEIIDGAYAAWSRAGTPIVAYRSFAHAHRIVRRHYARAVGPTYTYLYLLTVDKLSHEHGVGSDAVAEEVARVDRLLGRVRNDLPQSVRMIVTADHGLVDVPRDLHFSFRDNDRIGRHLVAGQTGEATTPVFHVRGAHDAFREAFAAHPASEVFSLYTPDELASRDLYGTEPLAEEMRARLGDYVAIARCPALFEYVASGRKPVDHVGVHGGLRPGEMRVPLLLA